MKNLTGKLVTVNWVYVETSFSKNLFILAPIGSLTVDLQAQVQTFELDEKKSRLGKCDFYYFWPFHSIFIQEMVLLCWALRIKIHNIILRSFVTCCFSLYLKTLVSISWNVISPITLNKKLGNHLNMDIINASILLRQNIVQLRRKFKAFIRKFSKIKWIVTICYTTILLRSARHLQYIKLSLPK